MGAESFGEAPQRVLEQIATGVPLAEVLLTIVHMIESHCDGTLCSVLLLDPATRTLHHGAAPHLPPEYVAAIDGEVIGPTRGSCGAAAALEEVVIIEDIETHPYWNEFRHLALPHGLRACWSTPIVSPTREVLGTFAFYYREKRPPMPEERAWANVATHLAAIAIGRDRVERSLRARETRASGLALLHSVAGNVGQATLGLREPMELYEFTCRTAVERGLVRMAWIGAYREAEDVVEPLARFGEGSDNVEVIRLRVRTPGGETLAAHALETGVFAIGNITTHPLLFEDRERAVSRGFRSCGVFPLRLDENTRGILCLYSAEPEFFREDEVNVLSALADTISFAVQSARNERARRDLFQAVVERERRLRLAHELGEALRETISPDEVLPVALEMLGTHLQASGCAYAVIGDDEDGARLVHEFLSPGSRSLAGSYRLSDFGPRLHALLRSGNSLVVDDIARDLPPDEAARLLSMGVQSFVCRTLIRDGKLRALITVNAAQPRAWSSTEVGIVEEFVERCWTTIERRAAETELRRSENLLRMAGRAARLGGWSVELPERRVTWSDEVSEMHGVPPGTHPTLDDALGYYAPEFREMVRERVDLCIRIGTPIDFEAQLVVGDTRKWIRSIGHAERSANGQITRIQGAVQDIDERRKLEEQLRHSQKMEGIGQLAGGVAHDFNNLLSVILSYASMILEDLPTDSALRPEVEEIQHAGVRASELTRQLLAFSRKQMLQPRVVDLNQIVIGLEKMLRRTVPENVTLVVDTPGPIGQVMADPGQIEQVLMNLVVNARDAMPNGGTITIHTTNVVLNATNAAESPEAKPGRYVLLSVADTGCGMDAPTRARVFEPFFTTKAQGKGTGLGLSTVYGIVAQTGGRIAVESAPGSGTKFQLHFPRIDRKLDDVHTESHAATTLRGTETILLVEDEDQVRTILHAILVRAGYHVLEAANGAAALDLATSYSRRIDLVLTDVVMPEMNGLALAKRMRELGFESKVLFMSGYTEDAIVHDGLQDGEIAFLPKPITPDALLRKVREVLS